MRDLTGRSIDAVLEAVDAALPPGGEEVLARIADRCEAADPGEREDGFVWWVCGLADGDWRLPATIPLAVLRVWADDPTAVPLLRCRTCKMAFPNRNQDGRPSGECWARPGCYLCGAAESVLFADLSRPGVEFLPWSQSWQ